MKAPSSLTVVSQTNRSNTHNNLSEYNNPNAQANVMMNGWAGPSDTQNFADAEFVANGDDDSETPFMGNHVVKTVRNLRMR